jgi:hypothetical protein
MRRKRTAVLVTAGAAVLLLSGCVDGAQNNDLGMSGSPHLTFGAEGGDGVHRIHAVAPSTALNDALDVRADTPWQVDVGDRAAPRGGEQLELTVSSSQHGRVACRITWGVAVVVASAEGDHPVAHCRARVHRLPDPSTTRSAAPHLGSG